MSLILIGMRGAGKTTAARLAAGALGVPWVDCDQEVEARSGKSVARIFDEEGEPAFRLLERQVLAELIAGGGLHPVGGPRSGEQLIATGGGCVLDPATRAELKGSGRVIWLRADPRALRRRIQVSDRPSLTGAPPAAELAELLRRREPLYAQCATVTIDTTHTSPQEVSRVIQQLWTDLPHHHLR